MWWTLSLKIMNYSDIQVKILQYLRIHPQGATGKTLSKYCKVSLNTIRREFNSLYALLHEDCMELISRPSIGYQLVILDEKEARLFFQQLNTQSNNPLFDNNKSHSYKANYIIRKLLTKNDYVPLMKIADELNYSESSVRRDLKWVEANLAQYALTLKQKKNYGLYIEGSELNKRLCLISQHKLFVNLSKSQQKLEPDFWITFAMGDAKIRNCVTKIRNELIGHPQLTFKLIDFPTVFNYIPIIYSRHKFSKDIQIDDEQKRCLEKGGLIDLSRELLVSISDVIDFDESEIVAFAMILQAYRSVTNVSQLTNWEREFMCQITKNLLSTVDQTIYVSDVVSHHEFDELVCILYGVMNKVIYCIEPDLETYRTFTKTSPFVEDLCIACATYLEGYFHKKISFKICLSFYYFFAMLLKKKLNTLLNLKIAIISTYGMQYGLYCKNCMLEEYAPYIVDIQVLEYSQITPETLNDVDYIISDVRIEMLPQGCKSKYCFLENQSYQNHRVKGFEDIVEHTLETLKNENMYFYDLEGKDINSCIDSICDYLQAEEGWKEKIKRRLYYECEQSHEYTLYLSCSSSEIKTGAYFFKLATPLDNTKINQIVCVTYNQFDYTTINILHSLLVL